ncbi:MAG TPA: hypothetical protein PKY82_24475 [Pyrinomonadaceae bacterium]|nr:hypothetical protein [Pyrinomonadaceae bacterium]
MTENFANIWLSHFRQFKTRKDVIDLYLQAIIKSYNSIDKSVDDENKIRNRFYWDLTTRNPLLEKYLEKNLIQINYEKWTMVSEEEERRVDLTFFISSFGSFEIECKCFFGIQTEKGQYLTNGLIRFIDLKYAKKDEFAGMIGFVVKGNTDDIFNSNVTNAQNFHPTNPTKSIQNPTNSNWKHSFTSFHERTDKSEITIYHLLFEFKKK